MSDGGPIFRYRHRLLGGVAICIIIIVSMSCLNMCFDSTNTVINVDQPFLKKRMIALSQESDSFRFLVTIEYSA